MKITKKTWTIIAIIGVVVLIYMLMGKKKDTSKMSAAPAKTPTPDDKKSESGYGRRTRGTGYTDVVGKLKDGSPYWACSCTGDGHLSIEICQDKCKGEGCSCKKRIKGDRGYFS